MTDPTPRRGLTLHDASDLDRLPIDPATRERDREAARAYLEQTDCEGGTFIYQSREEAEIFRRHLEKCCAGTKSEQWFFIPEKRAVAFHPETKHPFISYF